MTTIRCSGRARSASREAEAGDGRGVQLCWTNHTTTAENGLTAASCTDLFRPTSKSGPNLVGRDVAVAAAAVVEALSKTQRTMTRRTCCGRSTTASSGYCLTRKRNVARPGLRGRKRLLRLMAREGIAETDEARDSSVPGASSGCLVADPKRPS